jgi:hypothetical protein
MPKNINVKKKESNQNNSPWFKSARGRSFDNLPLSFTFTLFHNNNNNLSKNYFRKKCEFEGKNPKEISTS